MRKGAGSGTVADAACHSSVAQPSYPDDGRNGSEAIRLDTFGFSLLVRSDDSMP
ncbi:hypothetical protein [Castellaniella sp.]|uniref:hypothetical protein n=1 Tax=Castellaniella sp. TaxID=1955812 RepID=UPI002AFE4295|nr:hypothetical protein [Castellaniella sp.]